MSWFLGFIAISSVWFYHFARGGMLPLLLPLLAGVLVANYHWGTAVAIGALGVSFFVREKTGTPDERHIKHPES